HVRMAGRRAATPRATGGQQPAYHNGAGQERAAHDSPLGVGLSRTETATRAAHTCTVSSRPGRAGPTSYNPKRRPSQGGSLCRSLFRRPDQLLESWIVLDVAPPPVGRPRRPDAGGRVRGHLLLQQAEGLLAVTEQQ